MTASDHPADPTTDPLAVLRQRNYVALLVFAAIIGVPVAAGAFWFLDLVANLRHQHRRLRRGHRRELLSGRRRARRANHVERAHREPRPATVG